jgi:hypothetical protein
METELIYNIFITIVFAIVFLIVIYYLTPNSNYRLFLCKNSNKFPLEQQFSEEELQLEEHQQELIQLEKEEE